MQNTALVLSTATTTTTPRQLTNRAGSWSSNGQSRQSACSGLHATRSTSRARLACWPTNCCRIGVRTGRCFHRWQRWPMGWGCSGVLCTEHLVHLERVGLWVRKARPGRASIYELRLPGPTHSSAYPPTHASAHISNHREVTKKNVQRKRCAVCGNSWPETYGDDCFVCLKARTGPKPRGGMPTYTERPARESAPMTAQQTADAEERAIADGYRKVGGQWRKR